MRSSPSVPDGKPRSAPLGPALSSLQVPAGGIVVACTRCGAHITLTRAGFSPTDTLRTITLVDNYVLGSALDLTAPDKPWESGDPVGPELTAALATGAPRPARADDAFEYGLAVLLRGLVRA